MVTVVLTLEKTPAAREGTARLASRTAVESSEASLDRKRRAVEAPATVGEPPAFRMLLKTVSVPPPIVVDDDSVTAGTTRSGWRIRMALLTPVLLVSSDSATTLLASATTMRKYVPCDVLAGMVSVTVPVEDRPAPMLPTERVPSKTSLPSMVPVAERKIFAVEATVLPVPWFLIVLLIASDWPAAPVGALTAVTVRSGTGGT